MVVAQVFGLTGVLMQVRVSASGAQGTQLILAPAAPVKAVALNTEYVLGTPYTIRLSVGKGVISVFYAPGVVTFTADSVPFATYPTAETSAYFKVGNYLQSNVAHGEDPAATAQVSVLSLAVT